MKPIYVKPKFPTVTFSLIIGMQVVSICVGMWLTVLASCFLAGWLLMVIAPMLLAIVALIVAAAHNHRVRRYLATVCMLLLSVACSSALAQPAPPTQYAYTYQPTPGYWQPVPRYTCVGQWLFGPRFVFVPLQQQYPGPVQPQQQTLPAPQR